MQFVRDPHKASILRTCHTVWFDEESLLLPEGRLRASTKEDRWGVVAIATSVVPGKPSFPVGFGVAATCRIGRLKQVSLGGLEASWSANYTARVWYSSLSLCQTHPFLLKYGLSCFRYHCSPAQSIHSVVSFCLCYNSSIKRCLNQPFRVKGMWHRARTCLCLASGQGRVASILALSCSSLQQESEPETQSYEVPCLHD